MFLFLGLTLSSQNNVKKIIELYKTADSLVHSDPSLASEKSGEALELALKSNIDTLIYLSRFSKGISQYYIGNLNLALENFIANYNLAIKLKSQKKIIESLNAIANVYKDNERLDLALKTYKEAEGICVSSGNISKLSLIESNIAVVFNLQHKSDSSNLYCFKLLRDKDIIKKHDLFFISNIYSTIIANFIDLLQKDSVNKYADTTLALKKNIGDTNGYIGCLYNLAGFYNKISDFKTAEKYLEPALGVKIDNYDLMAGLRKAMGNVAYNTGRYKLAAELYYLSTCYRDTLSEVKTVEKLSEMEVKYETRKKEEELKRMSAEKEITDLRAKQSQIWLIVAAVGILFVVIIALILFKQNKNRLRANKLLQNQNDEIVHQKKEITDSINYAKRIQLAILPPDKMVKKLLPTAFVMYKPKDVVSGDFYWMEEKNGMVMFAAVDCTGHGVPGAMMSVVGLNLLNQAVKEKGLTTPSEILKHLDAGVTDTLRQSGDTDSIKDGMDLSLCSYDPKTLELQYAGAFNNLWVVRKNISSTYKLKNKFEVFFEEHLLEIKADKFPIGSNLDGVADNYTNHTLQLQKGDCVYLYSDGYADQFGGPKGKKYKYNSLKKLLVSIHELPPDEQREKLLSAFESWRGNLEQIDDILVMGVCV